MKVCVFINFLSAIIPDQVPHPIINERTRSINRSIEDTMTQFFWILSRQHQGAAAAARIRGLFEVRCITISQRISASREL